MMNQELIDFYKKLLIMQYADKPKALAHISALVSEVIAGQIVAQVRDGFDLDAAAGVQLRTLGKYRGTPEVVYGLDLSKNFFGFIPHGSAVPANYFGFAVHGQDDADISWFFLTHSDGSVVAYTLNDEEFRQLTKFRAAVHSSQMGVGEIDLILEEFFSDFVTLTDHGDMTITYNDDPSDPKKLFGLASESNSFPKPAGVAINYTNA